MSDYSYLILVLIVPFISFLINGLAGHRFSPKVAGLIGTSAIAVTFIAALAAAATYFGAHTGETAYTPIVALNMVWLNVITSYSIHYTKLYDCMAFYPRFDLNVQLLFISRHHIHFTSPVFRE